MPDKKEPKSLEASVDELIDSTRLKIAVRYFNEDPSLLKDIFIEMGEKGQNAAKGTIISEFMKYGFPTFERNISDAGADSVRTVKGLSKSEIRPYLEKITTFNKYDTSWPMKKDKERQLYTADPRFKRDTKDIHLLIDKQGNIERIA